MASPSGPGQPSGPDPGSVLRDNCKKSVLEPSQNTENVPLYERMRQVMNEWELSPRMWPVGYIIGSPYSPFRVEQELPNRNWRNAFEDLLALESGDEMVSHESRKQEKAVAARVNWERANHCIGKLSQYNAREAPGFNLAQTILNELKSSEHETDPALSSWLMKKIDIVKELAQRRVALAQAFKDREETRREWSASRHKDRGQWMASLITSGALRGWRSTLEDSEDGDVIHLTKDLVAPEDQDGISLSERELHDHFEDGKPFEQGLPGPPWYQLPPDEPLSMSKIPERPCFWSQTTTAERITLPDGRMVTKVVMKNYLTNGDVEEKVIVQEPGKVLQEVEKARALIQDRMFGFDQPT